MGKINVKLFNRSKYESNINKLKSRNAPKYIIEAYNRGYISVVNTYYNNKIKAAQGLTESKNRVPIKRLKEFVEASGLLMLEEALSKKDLDFLNLMYQMTNIDILTKHKRIPANAGKLIKQGEILDLGLTKLHKKLR